MLAILHTSLAAVRPGLTSGFRKLAAALALAAVVVVGSAPSMGLTTAPAAAAPNCQHTIGTSVTTADGNGNYSSVKPGDTVCIQAGSRRPLTLRNFKGSSSAPITFINSGGRVTITGSSSNYAGIYFQNSEYVRITGTGDAAYQKCGSEYPENGQACGIVVDGTSRGLSGRQRTGRIEVDHIEFRNLTEAGITINNTSENRDSWNQYDTKVHHNYVHDVADAEGMYIGGSSYNSGEEPLLYNTDVSYNLVRNTGWDGIQVGSAVQNCNVHHNKIANDSQKFVSSQKSSVMINPGSVCNVYNNWITDGASRGIYVQGNGGNKLYNNVIIRAGRKESSGNGDGSGIIVFTGSNKGQSISVWNNTIVEPKGHGVKYENSKGSGNRIQNNLIAAPGGSDIAKGGSANVTVSNNVTSGSTGAVGFNNPSANDFSLRTGCIAVDKGVNLTSEGITKDYAGNPRPAGSAFDAGAYEHVTGAATPTPVKTATVAPTATPVKTATPAPTATPVKTATPAKTATAAPTATATPVKTAVATPTPTNTPAPTATPTTAPAPKSELLGNPDFESDSNGDGRPDSWYTHSSFTRSNDVVHGGSYAGKVSSSRDSSFELKSDVKGIKAGTTYDFSGYVNIPKTGDSFKVEVLVRWHDSKSDIIKTETVKTYTGSTDGWDHVAGSYKAPEGATLATVRLHVKDFDAKVYVDDFSFR